MRLRRVLVIALGAAIWACGPASALGGSPGSDSLQITTTVADLDSAWAHGDADRWARHYAADADFINILGMLFSDAKTMHARHHEIFTGVFRGSRHEGTIRRMRFPAPQVAIVDVDIAVTGFQALPPGAKPTDPGVLRTRMRHVFHKIDGRWKIIATQNTAVAPPGPAR